MMNRHFRSTLFAAAAVLGAGCSVLPVSEEYMDAAPNDVAAATADGSSVRECRWAKATGTKMRTRICYSQEVWARLDAAVDADRSADSDEFFRRQRENATASGNVAVPNATGGGIGF